MCSYRVEVPQEDDPPRLVRSIHIPEHVLNDELAAAVRADCLQGMSLIQWYFLRLAIDCARRREDHLQVNIPSSDQCQNLKGLWKIFAAVAAG